MKQHVAAPGHARLVVPTSGRRQSVSAISAVNTRGAFWYAIYTGRLNASRFVAPLTHFMRGRRGPVFLVLDTHPTHIAKVAAQYVQRLAGRLELHSLPGYAPELNPDEFVWNRISAPTRGLRPRNPVLGEASEGAVEAPSDEDAPSESYFFSFPAIFFFLT